MVFSRLELENRVLGNLRFWKAWWGEISCLVDLVSLFSWVSFFGLFSLVLSHYFGKDLCLVT